MLRRYLIANGISTAVMYGAAWAIVLPLTGAVFGLVEGVKVLAMDNMWLAPLFNRIVTVTSGI